MKIEGFTLIELIVVIAIIAILAAIITPLAIQSIEKAKIAALIADYQAAKKAAGIFRVDTKRWPACADHLLGPHDCCDFACPEPPPTIPRWDGPYLEKWPPNSRWGESYDVGGPQSACFFTISRLPLKIAQKIDIRLDGAENGTTGSVLYDSNDPTDLTTILIAGTNN